MPKHFLNKIEILYVFLAIVLAFLYLHLSYFCYFADSEIWLLTLSQKVFQPSDLVSIYYKYFFHLFTKFTTFLAQTNVDTYKQARLSFALLSLLTLILNAFVFTKIFNNKKLFVPIFIFTLSSSLFFNQGFRIRADILVTFFHCLYLLVFLYSKKFDKKTTLLLTTITIFMILTTPKAILFIVSYFFLGLLFYFHSSEIESRKKAVSLILSVLIPLYLGLLLLMFFIFFQPQNQIFIALQSALDFYIKSFDPELGGSSLFKSYDFMYFFRFLKTSWAQSVLMIFWFFSFLINSFLGKSKSDLRQTFHIYTAVLFLLIIAYNQKLPFFLGSFLTPVIAFQLCFFYDWTKTSKILKPLFSAILLVAFTTSLFQYISNLSYNNNHDQLQFISELEKYKLKNPDITIYDVIGLLPKNNSHYFFVGPGEVSRRELIFAQLIQQSPDLYIYTFKNNYFEPALSSFLNQNYFQYLPGVWIKSINYNLSEDTKAIEQVIKLKNIKYWLIVAPKTNSVHIYESTSGQEITSQCLFFDSAMNPSEQDIQWVAIPFLNHRFSLVSTPLPVLTKNPHQLFRFDTSF
jgi:hypothetical protein